MSVYDRINYDNYVWYDEIRDRQKYLKLLDALERRTWEIEYVQGSRRSWNENDAFIKSVRSSVKSCYPTDEWTTYSHPGNNEGMMYRLKADKAVFKRLRAFGNFFEKYSGNDKYLETWTDIAFYDKDGVPLFYTLTHEDEAFISLDFLKELNNDNKKRKN